MKPLSSHLFAVSIVASAPAAAPGIAVAPETPAQMFQLSSVRLLDEGPFSPAVKANREYVLAHDPARLLAPFRREAGLPAEAQPYGNWESSGIGRPHARPLPLGAGAHDRRRRGHSGRRAPSKTEHGDRRAACLPEGLGRRLHRRRSRKAASCGRPWPPARRGRSSASWVPWYNLHKTFAGLRDAYLEAGSAQRPRHLGSLR